VDRTLFKLALLKQAGLLSSKSMSKDFELLRKADRRGRGYRSFSSGKLAPGRESPLKVSCVHQRTRTRATQIG
jgi:hypothetical protein